MVGSSTSVVQAANEYFDALVKSRFIEMFGDPISNPNNWPQNKLNSLVIIERGGSPRPIDAFITEDENGLNWIKIGDANDSFYIEFVKEKIRPEGLKKTRQVFKGDLILSNSMSFGRPYILKIDGCIHDGWLLIRDNNKLFDKVFLCIALSQPTVTNYFKGQARGAVVNNLNKDIVGKMPMYIPPIELQNQFADFVRQVDKSKLLFQQVVSKYDELVKSRFIEMFGDVYVGTGRWEKQSFCDIVEFNPKKSELPAEDFDVSFVPMECVGTDNSMVPQCTKKKSEVIKGYTYFKNNDVVIAKITPCFENGKIAVAHDLLNGVGFGTTEFHVARPKEGISNPIWILNLLLLNSLKINANQNMTGSAGQKRIQTDYFKRLMVEVPPIELQNQFADFVRQVDKSKSDILEGIKRLKTNRITEQ